MSSIRRCFRLRSPAWALALSTYSSSERHSWKKHDDVVEIFQGEGHWASRNGLDGMLEGEQPLDELSFLFYLRTLALAPGSTLTVSRHFDQTRNPTVVRVLGREVIEVATARFRAIAVEMLVRDARHYEGDGAIRIYLSDDSCRPLLRIESKLPDAGAATLALASYEGTRRTCTAKIPPAMLLDELIADTSRTRTLVLSRRVAVDIEYRLAEVRDADLVMHFDVYRYTGTRVASAEEQGVQVLSALRVDAPPIRLARLHELARAARRATVRLSVDSLFEPGAAIPVVRR